MKKSKKNQKPIFVEFLTDTYGGTCLSIDDVGVLGHISGIATVTNRWKLSVEKIDKMIEYLNKTKENILN